jgi:hypothetical protein
MDMSDPEDRNRSFAEQLGDALSLDPSRRSAAGDNLADQKSQALANDLAGNHPSLLERGLFGQPGAESQITQSCLDDVFGSESDED